MKSLKNFLEKSTDDHVLAEKVTKYVFQEKIALASTKREGERGKILVVDFEEYCSKVERLKAVKKEGMWLAWQLYDISNDGQICDLDVMSLMKLQAAQDLKKTETR